MTMNALLPNKANRFGHSDVSKSAGSVPSAVTRFELERQLNSVLYHANESNLRGLIRSLLVARNEHDLDDEAFSKVMELVLAKYVENEVNAKVETLIGSIIGPNIKGWIIR